MEELTEDQLEERRILLIKISKLEQDNINWKKHVNDSTKQSLNDFDITDSVDYNTLKFLYNLMLQEAEIRKANEKLLISFKLTLIGGGCCPVGTMQEMKDKYYELLQKTKYNNEQIDHMILKLSSVFNIINNFRN